MGLPISFPPAVDIAKVKARNKRIQSFVLRDGLTVALKYLIKTMQPPHTRHYPHRYPVVKSCKSDWLGQQLRIDERFNGNSINALMTFNFKVENIQSSWDEMICHSQFSISSINVDIQTPQCLLCDPQERGHLFLCSNVFINQNLCDICLHALSKLHL